MYSPRGKIWYSEQTISPDERARGTLCNMEPGCFVNWTCSVLFCNIIIFISRLWTLGQMSFDCGEVVDVDATGDSASFAIVAQMIFSGTDLMEGHPFDRFVQNFRGGDFLFDARLTGVSPFGATLYSTSSSRP